MFQLKPLIHKATRYLWYGTVTMLVLIAVAVTIARTFFPELHTYKATVEGWASDAIGQRVHIGDFDARLVGITPTFIFNDVQLVDDNNQEIIRFDEARIGLSTFSSLRKRVPVPKKVTLSGISLSVTRQENGDIVLQGIDLVSQKTTTDRPENSQLIARWFFERGNLAVRNSTIVWRDMTRSGDKHVLQDVNLVLRNNGDIHYLRGSFLPPVELGSGLKFEGRMTGELEDIGHWNGQFRVSGERLDISELEPLTPWLGVRPQEGRLDIDVWGSWGSGQLRSMQGKLQVDRASLRVDKQEKDLVIRSLDATFGWQSNQQGWRLDVSGFDFVGSDKAHWPELNFAVQRYNETAAKPARLEISAGHLPVGEISRVLIHSGMVPEPHLGKLQTLDPRGNLHNVYIKSVVVDPFEHPFELSATFGNLGFNASSGLPGADGLSGSVRFTERRGTLFLDSKSTVLDFPGLFRTPLKADKLYGHLGWHYTDSEWHLITDRLVAENSEVKTETAVNVTIPADGIVYMDLQSRFFDGDAAKKSTYLPTGIMDDALVKWLDESIIAGTIIEGGVVFNGRLQDFPFVNNEGRFLVSYDAKDMRLQYEPNWPEISQSRMHVEFNSQGVSIDVAGGEMAGNDVAGAEIRIPSYFDPVLELRAGATGGTQQVLEFLYNSPIAAGAGDFLRATKVTGVSTADLELFLPLSENTSKTHPTRYTGYIELDDSGFGLFDGQVVASNARGKIRFTEKEISADELTASMWGSPVEFSINTVQQGTKSVTQVNAKGKTGLPELLAQQELIEIPVANPVDSGDVTWTATFGFGGAASGNNDVPHLAVNAEIKNAHLSLPAPLNFTQQDVIPVSLSVSMPVNQGLALQLDIDDRVSTALAWQTVNGRPAVQRGELRFGGTAMLPESNIFHVVGSPRKIELKRWLAVASALRRKDETANASSLPVVLNLGNVEVVPSEGKSASVDLRPHDLPLLRGSIKHFQFNEMDLGRLEVATSESRGIYNIDKLNLSSDVFDINLWGTLSFSHGVHSTTLHLKVSSSDVGAMAKQLNYVTSIEGATGETDVTLYWGDSLSNFSWDKVSGTARIKMENGAFVDIEPGAGRLFGLLSLSALPRRLVLDFSDMKKGFHFDRLQGDLRITNGEAFNDDLRIIGRSGTLQLKGRTSLVVQDFDQKVTVKPKIGDAVAVGTGFAFGPQVGVVVLLLERLLGQPLNTAASVEYQVSGSWDAPVIERLRTADEELPAEDEDET